MKKGVYNNYPLEHCRDGCYRRGDEDEWIPFQKRIEKIKRKKKSDVIVTFYENDHGVLDGDPPPGGVLSGQQLAAADSITTADIAAMQMDVYSIQAAEFMQVLRPLLPDSETGKILAAWDCCYDTDSRGALAFELFYRALYIELFAPGMGTEVIGHLIDTTSLFIDFYQNFDRLLMAESSLWHGERTRQDLFRAAAACLPDMLPGTWGQQNRITLTNIFFNGRMPGFLGFDRGPYALPGGRATPHQGQIYQSNGRTTSFAPLPAPDRRSERKDTLHLHDRRPIRSALIQMV